MPAGKRSDAMFCSKACQKVAYCALERAGRLEDKANRPPCQHCGGAIPAAAPAHTIYCGKPCQRRGIYHRQKAARQRTCVICGGAYLACIETQTTCSWKCGQASLRLAEPITCLHCGATITTPTRGQKFCNPRCQDRWHKAQRRQAGAFSAR